MAQGYIVPLDDAQRMLLDSGRIEDIAEEYISTLLWRCFFQDVEHNKYGEIVSFKMHDLMHDMAQKVATKEICVTNDVENIDKKVRHLAHKSRARGSINVSFTKSHIRSFLFFINLCQSSLEALLANWTCLRALDLIHLKLQSLPESLGDMLHLRYLDLSRNDGLEVLPNSITKLYNLQTLKLQHCLRLKVLPKYLMKLVNLRILDIQGCITLTNMPQGMSKLTNLHILSMFLVDGTNLSQKQFLHQLGELRNLSDSLKGELQIRVKLCENDRGVKEDGGTERGYLRSKEHLWNIEITVDRNGNEEEAVRLMEGMQPHSNLKGFELLGHKEDVRMPSWVEGKNLTTNLPNLVKLTLEKCDVVHLTCLGNLPHLKVLSLRELSNLEYMHEFSVVTARSEPTSSMSDGLSSIKRFFFPSLVDLELIDLPKLKEWRNSGLELGDNDQLHNHTSSSSNNNNNNMMELISLSQLEFLYIIECPNMSCSLLCPNVEHLLLEKFNERVEISMSRERNKVVGDDNITSTTTSLSSSSSSSNVHKLIRVEIDNVSWVNSIAMEDFQSLNYLWIRNDMDTESLGEATTVFSGSSLSLRTLSITNCSKLQSAFAGGLEQLTALEYLRISDCPMLRLSGERESGDGIDMSQLSLCHSLRRLELYYLPQMTDLPIWIQFLAALQSLDIYNCKGLKCLPDWMPKLTSLKEMELRKCSAELKERCQRSTGEDWPHIHHNSSIKIDGSQL